MSILRAAQILAVVACAALPFETSAASPSHSTPAQLATKTDSAGEAKGCTAADEGPQCLAEEFTRADDRINDTYQRLLATAPGDSRADLVAQQRSWLDRRDATCRLDARRARSSSWIPYVLEDRTRAVCVLRFTHERTAELDTLVAIYTRRASGDRAGTQFEVRPQNSDAEYLAVSPEGHQKGRWYFEVVIDLGQVRSRLEATLAIGIGRPDGQTNIGTTFHIRPMDLVVKTHDGGSVTIVNGNMGADAHLSKAFVGIAADLDAGRVYVRRGTQWFDGEPGSSGGSEVRLGRDYRAIVYSSVLLNDLVKQGIVSVNFGSNPFMNAVPDGYEPFEPRASASGTSSQASPFLPPLSRVAGQSTEYWVRRYWEWTRAFPAGQKPSSDRTGEFCAAGQKGPVWFLTGFERSATVQRSCDVPANTVLLVPIINSLIWSAQGGTEPCHPLMLVRLAEATSTVSNLRLSLDGVSLERPEAYHAATGCFELHDVPRDVTGTAAADGYWVFIGPLSPGQHDIRFGGRFDVDSFWQDIHYVLNVQ